MNWLILLPLFLICFYLERNKRKYFEIPRRSVNDRLTMQNYRKDFNIENED